MYNLLCRNCGLLWTKDPRYNYYLEFLSLEWNRVSTNAVNICILFSPAFSSMELISHDEIRYILCVISRSVVLSCETFSFPLSYCVSNVAEQGVDQSSCMCKDSKSFSTVHVKWIKY